MSDLTSNPPRRPAPGRRRTAEFHVYFTLIVLLAIPFATERWIAQIIRERTLDLPGPLARARAEAERITPLIFSA